MKQKFKKFLPVLFAVMAVFAFMAVPAFAEEYVGQSLVTAEDLAVVTSFGADAKATIPVMLGVIIPLSLGISMLPLFIKKGIGWVMGAVRRA